MRDPKSSQEVRDQRLYQKGEGRRKELSRPQAPLRGAELIKGQFRPQAL